MTILIISLFISGCSCSILKRATKAPQNTTAPVSTEDTDNKVFTFDDDSLPAFWNVVQYVTLADASGDVYIGNGTLTMTDNSTDRAPILISDPIKVTKGDVVTVSRRVKLHYANYYYQGAMRITSVDSDTLNVVPDASSWSKTLGDIMTNIDYLHYDYAPDGKAAKDGFVLYDVSTGGFSPAEIVSPIFDEWFEETLIYDTSTGKVTWKLNNTEYSAQGLPLDKDYVCIVMHGYGWYTGHSMDMDNISIKIDRA